MLAAWRYLIPRSLDANMRLGQEFFYIYKNNLISSKEDLEEAERVEKIAKY
jgi:hypothetical protein